MKRGPWIQTYSGRKMYVFDPSSDDIALVDIAHGLSNLCRFNGHVKRFYSVAQHSVHASTVVTAPNQQHALLHDAAEAYFGDLSRPIKHALGLEVYVHAEKTLRGLIFRHFGLDEGMPEAVREADGRMLYTERAQLMAPLLESDESWGHGVIYDTPYTFELPAWSPYTAKARFLDRFLELFGELPRDS